MSVVTVDTLLRTDDGRFVPIRQVERWTGDCRYVPGAIELTVDDHDVLSTDLWDDVNWLWPLVLQALDECARTGSGERYFPSQPLVFGARRLGRSAQLQLTVAGGSVGCKAVGSGQSILAGVGAAALSFFDELRRLCPDADDSDAIALAERLRRMDGR